MIGNRLGWRGRARRPPAGGFSQSPRRALENQAVRVAGLRFPCSGLTTNSFPSEPALRQLTLAATETVLAACLDATDPATVQLAAAGLWECWLNEKGPEARRRMDEGVERLLAGDLAAVQKTFHGLSVKHPDWAEAINKKARALPARAGG